MSSTDDYVELVPSENTDKPHFIAMLRTLTGGFSDEINALISMQGAFDLDTAVGDQLDILGKWIGLPRTLSVPILVFFSFDVSGLGFDQGNWKGPDDPGTGLVMMDDDTYRIMLKAKIGANVWDGTRSQYLLIMNLVLGTSGISVTLKDHQDMSFTVTLSARPPALLYALITSGYIPIKPVGVKQIFSIP